MLAVVVLLPIAIMVATMLLERFEARTVAVRRPERASRADLRTPAPAAPHLSLVRDTVAELAETAGGRASVGLDSPTPDLRRAS